MIRHSRLYRFACLFALCSALGLLLIPVVRADDIRKGDNWIEHGGLRVSVGASTVSVHMKDAETSRWDRMATGRLDGFLSHTGGFPGDAELMRPYREKYGGFYLFGNESELSEIKTGIRDGLPVASFRVSLEDLWIDTEITILGAGAMVLVEAVDKSQDTLVPHWRQYFHRTYERDAWLMPAMTHLVYDDRQTSEPREISAIDERDRHKIPVSSRYCISYNPRADMVWGFLWPPLESRRRTRIQYPPGAITIAYLDAPYVFFGAVMDEEPSKETVSRLGESMYEKMSGFFK